MVYLKITWSIKISLVIFYIVGGSGSILYCLRFWLNSILSEVLALFHIVEGSELISSVIGGQGHVLRSWSRSYGSGITRKQCILVII